MAIDTSFGEVRKFEDFLVTQLSDLPEMDFEPNDSGADDVVSGGADGRFRLSLDGDGSNDRAALTFGALNWTAGSGYLKMEARVIISAITDYTLFVGFGDAIATGDQTIFDAASDTVTSGSQSDAIGIFWDGDQSTDQLWAVAQANSSITVDKGLGTDTAPVGTIPTTLGVYLSKDRKSAQFYVDGKEVYRIDSDSVLISAVDLVPTVSCLDQGSATNIDVDYLYGVKGRSAT